MAPATQQRDDEKAMATDVIAPRGADEGDEKPQHRPPAERAETGSGFFHIYKNGQGYWTRMGTAGCAALIALLTASFLYQHLPVWIGAGGMPQANARSISLYIIAAFLGGFALLVFWLMNKPANAD